jgi:phosphoribosylformylglycinamidine (FGAM) synthase PurS component
LPEVRIFRVEVCPRSPGDPHPGQHWVRIVHELGITALTACDVTRLFFLRGAVPPAAITQLSAALLADPVTETFTAQDVQEPPASAPPGPTIEVALLPGVTDPVAENLVRAAHLLGLTGVESAATGQQYRLQGNLSAQDLEQLAVKVFANPVIQRYAINERITPPPAMFQPVDETVAIIPLRQADDAALQTIGAERQLALDLAEMQAIRAYYQREGRDPTDIELEMLAQSWSEHCFHKTFKATVQYDGPPPGAAADASPVPQTIHSLFDTYIRRATEQLAEYRCRTGRRSSAGRTLRPGPRRGVGRYTR